MNEDFEVKVGEVLEEVGVVEVGGEGGGGGVFVEGGGWFFRL